MNDTRVGIIQCHHQAVEATAGHNQEYDKRPNAAISTQTSCDVCNVFVHRVECIMVVTRISEI